MIQSEMQHAGAQLADAEIKPLVTVLVKTRNNEAHIRECLCGLMEQSIADRMEVIVIDQASQQSEWAVIPELQRRYSQIISLRIAAAADVNSGIDLALRMATGTYVTVVEATDRMRRDAYQLLVGALEERGNAVLAYGDTRCTVTPHETFDQHTSHGTIVWPEYSKGGELSQFNRIPPHLMWRRDVHQTVGPFVAARDFLLRIVSRFPVLHVQECTGLTLVRPETDPDRALAAIAAVTDGADPRQAVTALEEHLRRFPDHPVAHNNLGAVYYRTGDTEGALRHYRLAVQLAPEDATYQKNLADLLFVEGTGVDEAISIYLELHKRSPGDVETLLNLGIICEGVGQPAEADSFYQRALEIEPWNQAVRERLTELRAAEAAAEEPPREEEVPVEERYQRAQALVEEGDLQGAALELELLLSAYPEFAPAHNDLAVLSYQSGSKEKALAHYEKAAALAPDNSTFQKNLADFYFVEGGNIDGAIQIYLDQLRKEPRDVETLMSLGKICVLLDRPQEAESFYGKVTQLEPWNMDARECLSNLRQCANG